MNHQLMFSKESDHWSTPYEMYNYFIENGYLDPCPLHSEHNGLLIDYGCINLFINPPYSDITTWIDYAINHVDKNHTTAILLIPSRTDTKYFHKLLDHGVDIQFIKGRLKFGDSKNSAPFPSLLIKLESKDLEWLRQGNRIVTNIYSHYTQVMSDEHRS